MPANNVNSVFSAFISAPENKRGKYTTRKT